MTRPQQLAEELRLVSKLVDLLRVPLRTPPTPCQPPLPDFQLSLEDGRSIGLEVRESRDPELAEAWNATLPQFSNRIKSALEDLGATARVLGSVYLEEFSLVRRAALNAAVAQIVSVVIAAPAEGFQKSGSKFPGLGFLSFLAVTSSSNVDVSFGASGQPLGPGLIQLAINDKAPKLARYRQLGASEYWLMVVGGATLSGHVTVDDARSRIFESPFDRTIFLDDSEDQHHILSTVDSVEGSES